MKWERWDRFRVWEEGHNNKAHTNPLSPCQILKQEAKPEVRTGQAGERPVIIKASGKIAWADLKHKN